MTGLLTKNFTPLVTKHFKPLVKTGLLTKHFKPQVKTVLLTQNFMPLVKTGLLANNFMLLVVLTFPLRETHLVMLKGGVHLMQTPLVLTFPLKETHLVTRKGQLHMMQTPLVLTFPPHGDAPGHDEGIAPFAQAANCDLGFDGAAADPGETSASAQDLANRPGVLGGG